MMMEPIKFRDFTKDLTGFKRGAIAFAICATLSPYAGAAIVYNDIADVQILKTGTVSYDLDLNGDGVTEMTLSHGTFGNFMRIDNAGTDTSWIRDPATPAYNKYPDQLSFGEAIDGTGQYVTDLGWNFGASYDPSTAWTDGTGGGAGSMGYSTGYLGLRFELAGAYHYGWAYLDYSDGGILGATLESYAYEDAAGVGILAGATGSATPVPVPAAAWLLGSGLVGLAGWQRRRRLANQA